MVFRLVIIMVLLAPLPFALTLSWAWGSVAVLTGALLVAWSVELISSRDRPALGLKTAWPLILPYLCVAAWAAIQTLPALPEGWHHPLWQSTTAVLPVDVSGAISLNQNDTLDGIIRLLAYAGIFWLAFQYGRDLKQADLGLHALVAAGTVYSLYGLVVEFTQANLILWYPKPRHFDDLTSTFLNRNTFATYAGFTLICITALILRGIARSLGSTASVRQGMRSLFQEFGRKGWGLLLCLSIVFSALLLSHSRAGFFSSLLGLAILFTALGFSKTIRPRTVAASLIGFIFVLVGFLALSGEGLNQRLVHAPIDLEGRTRIYELELEAIKSTPLLGTGYGTFEEVFRFYRNEDVQVNIDKAHNSYLEIVLELGIPGAALLILSVLIASVICLHGIRHRHRSTLFPAIGIAVSAQVAVHSLVDFSLQIPAVAITYSFLLGICCAQS
ncbi:MAG: O-antigen ligase family protein, partial [Kiloniellales bacterium]|nr:O-antigen ligase family protein [Kiloniellales bacterium]